ncbi:MAG: DUF2256 domain-containing protein [Chloroflexaceae bacterium]
MRGVKTQHLPEKICAACGRPFRWRKSLARTWDEVKSCGDACRRYRGSGGKRPQRR